MANLYKSEEVEVFFIDETGKIIRWLDVKKQNKNIKNVDKSDDNFHDYLATRNNKKLSRNERRI